MPLKVELKPHERIIIGQAVIRNGEQRARFFIEGDAPVLREKDVLTAATADSPARRIYLAVQLMYLGDDLSIRDEIYRPLVREFLEAAPSAAPLVAEVNDRVAAGDLYKGLRSAKKLVAYEQELLRRPPCGDRTSADRADHDGATGA
jgi:flagellar protein FlbT